MFINVEFLIEDFEESIDTTLPVSKIIEIVVTMCLLGGLSNT